MNVVIAGDRGTTNVVIAGSTRNPGDGGRAVEAAPQCSMRLDRVPDWMPDQVRHDKFLGVIAGSTRNPGDGGRAVEAAPKCSMRLDRVPDWMPDQVRHDTVLARHDNGFRSN